MTHAKIKLTNPQLHGKMGSSTIVEQTHFHIIDHKNKLKTLTLYDTHLRFRH